MCACVYMYYDNILLFLLLYKNALFYFYLFACLLILIIRTIIVLTNPLPTRKTWILYTKKED